MSVTIAFAELRDSNVHLSGSRRNGFWYIFR